MVMNNWTTIAAVALALTLILPSLAIPEERPEDVTGQVLGLDLVRGVIALFTRHGVMYVEGPPAALEGVKVGDVIELKVVREAAQTRSPSPRDHPGNSPTPCCVSRSGAPREPSGRAR
jgi:hypothetical protein